MRISKYLHLIILLTLVGFGFRTVNAQQDIAQQAYGIIQQNCINCHGPHGPFTEQLVIESAPGLVATGTVVPWNPDASEFYNRLLGPTRNGAQMPFNLPPLSQTAIATIRQWIQAGAPDWEIQHDVNFITTDTMLTAMQRHLASLDSFSRPFARYFTTTHLYNAGESLEALGAYQIALSKLANSLSWDFNITKPIPINNQETIFYIDLRNYGWDIRDAWTRIEEAYPYAIAFNATTQSGLLTKLTQLQGDMNCEVPFVHVDWFLANASLPPLYHDILDLPANDQELERELGIDVERNLQSAPGVRVWRAGFNESGVSNNNRVVERHRSPYGAYWKSYDFAGSTGAKNVLTHPLSFTHDGGEIIFNLPNRLQAYYISDALGNRIDVAPTEIVSNQAASDPAVRNGLSCIGCHTEGMKEFEDDVRSFVEQITNPTFDKEQVLRLYVEKSVMDAYIERDKQHYKTALEETGGVFGGIEPVHRFFEEFQNPLDASHAAAAVGLETSAFLAEIGEKSSLQNLGLAGLLDGGNVQRDAWTEQFQRVIAALYFPDAITSLPPVVDDLDQPTSDEEIVSIPDANLRAVIEEMLSKTSGTPITTVDMARLTRIDGHERGIRNLTGLEHAVKLERIELEHNSISDLSALEGLIRLDNIKLAGNRITDVSPLANLNRLDWLGLEENQITDLSPLSGLIKLNGIGISHNPISNISPLSSLRSLEGINARGTNITDFSALAQIPRFRWIEFGEDKSISELPTLKGLTTLIRLDIRNCSITDLSGLEDLTQLTSLILNGNLISDLSPLAGLTNLNDLHLARNLISDVSSLKGLTGLKELYLDENLISDVSPLAELTNLEELWLQHNAISDFSPLKELSEKIIIRSAENPGVLKQGGPKITGPWLWVMVPPPTDNFFENRDYLSQASGGTVREINVATNGAIQGEAVGDNTWISQKINPNDGDNIRIMLRSRGFEVSQDRGRHLVYGVVTLNSPREQETTMFAGSDDQHKVWLNGELVDEEHDWHHDYQKFFPVTLKQGKNIILVAVHSWGWGWGGHFGFAPDAEYTVISDGARFSLSAAKTQVKAGTTFTVNVRVEGSADLAGWQTDITYDPAVIRATKVNEGNFLQQNRAKTLFQEGTIDNKLGRITGIGAVRRDEGGVSGQGTLLSLKLRAKDPGKTRLSLRNFQPGSSTGESISTQPISIIIVVKEKTTAPAWDVNEDGVTNAKDVQLVKAARGESPPKNPRTDVNRDGVVNGKDVAVVTAHLGEGAEPAAPLFGVRVYNPDIQLPFGLTPEMIEETLDILRSEDDGSLPFQQGIANLERLLASFVPEETALLHNYPNPFNPETWIPYQLVEAADVTFRIYAINGALVRTLDLGHQPAGIYQYRSRAAYWDGNNEVGEPVASGVYFYTLTAGDFTATRKMLIRK